MKAVVKSRSGFGSERPTQGARILFVGAADSSHAHSWMDLTSGQELDVRFFALGPGTPPSELPIESYVCAYRPNGTVRDSRRLLFPRSAPLRLARYALARVLDGGVSAHVVRWLSTVVREWKPDIVHTFGLLSGGRAYAAIHESLSGRARPIWVAQIRGGSDLALQGDAPEDRQLVRRVVQSADRLIADNERSIEICTDLGARDDQLGALGVVPGTGGIDVDAMAALTTTPPSQRHVVLWPKGFECQWSKSVPVVEAIRQAQSSFSDAELHVTAACPETRAWIAELPEPLRAKVRVHSRIPRGDMLELMARARAVLAPSLVDGRPNVMFEAMASGAAPIVSPLDSIVPVVEDRTHVLYARNLYPDEIAAALRTALEDDQLVDSMAAANRVRVRQLADRSVIRTKVNEFYRSLIVGRR